MKTHSQLSPAINRRDFNAEARIQASIVDWVRTVAPDLVCFHPPNGGLRSKSEAARLKWIGVLAGVPDLVVIGCDGQIWLIEVKTDDGALSSDQRAMRDRLTAMRVPYAVARSTDDVRKAFAIWGIETRETAR